MQPLCKQRQVINQLILDFKKSLIYQSRGLMIPNPYGLSATNARSPRGFGPPVRGIQPSFGNSRRANLSPARTMTNIGASTTPIINPLVSTSAGTIPAGYTVGSSTNVQEVLGSAPIQGESRLEYIPYERKYIDYEAREQVDRVPVERTVIDYQQVKRIEYVPRERRITDYYAIEHQTNYVPQTIPEKKIEYVPIETVTERVEYIPVERQVIHYPEDYGAGLSRRVTGAGQQYSVLQNVITNPQVQYTNMQAQPLIKPSFAQNIQYVQQISNPNRQNAQSGSQRSMKQVGVTNQTYLNGQFTSPLQLKKTQQNENTVKKDIGPLMSFGRDHFAQLKRPQTQYKNVEPQQAENINVPSANPQQNLIRKESQRQMLGSNKAAQSNGTGPTPRNGMSGFNSGVADGRGGIGFQNGKMVTSGNIQTSKPESQNAQITRTLFKQSPKVVQSEYFAVMNSLQSHEGLNRNSSQVLPVETQMQTGRRSTSKGRSSGIRLTMTSNKRPVSVAAPLKRCMSDQSYI